MSKIKYAAQFEQDLQHLRLQLSQAIEWNLIRVGKDFADGDDFSFFNEHTFDEQINKVFKNGTIDIAEDVVSIQQALDDELITIEDGISLLQALEQL